MQWHLKLSGIELCLIQLNSLREKLLHWLFGCAVTGVCALCSRCAQLLLEAGADVNVRTQESRLTPLHVASRLGLEEHVQLLLSHGADVLATNREGETPLNAACSAAEWPEDAGRYLRVIQKLLEAGANPRTAGRKQHTPLHNACANCKPRIADALLQHGARADVSNCAGYTPMDCLLQVALKAALQWLTAALILVSGSYGTQALSEMPHVLFSQALPQSLFRSGNILVL